MTNSYNLTNPEEEHVKKILSDLPHHNAPEGFEDKLMENIRRIDNGEDVTMLKSESKSWLVPTLSTAAGLAFAFILFNTFDGTTVKTKTDQQMANTPIEVKTDSTKEIQTTNSQQLNLVKDKK